MRYFAYCRKSTEGEDRQALSIPAQIDEIKRTFSVVPEVEIVEWLEEKKSAKAPGRSVYASMIKRIEAGEADGIVAWHPDRLARNSVDGGWIIHLLDQNVIKDLKFVSYTFEKSPQGMFMLQIMFGQSKYYVDALSVNVKRGLRKRIELGWHPNLAPLGYRNDKETGTIVIDPQRFPLMRRMWEMLLSGGYAVSKINEIANDEWGFRTPIRRRSGGKRLALSATYRIFTNPFYAGLLIWNGEVRAGKHQPMVTMEEFERGRKILGKPDAPNASVHAFAYTGLIRCSCGLAVTAEEKVKPSGRRYVYYHCTRRSQPRCDQPAITGSDLNVQIASILAGLTYSDAYARQLSASLQDGKRERLELAEQRRLSTAQALEHCCGQLRALTDLRLKNLLDDREYVERKKELQLDRLRLEQALNATDDGSIWLELADAVILFRNYAVEWFSAGTLDDKRLILETISSNSVLSNKTLSIQARIPFRQDADPAYFPNLRGAVDEVGTPAPDMQAAKLIVACVSALKVRAAARAHRTPVPSFSPLSSTSRTAPRGRASWKALPAPDPASTRSRTLRGKAA